MHQRSKPVRKCHGCGLNLRDHCGVYENPHKMWHSHRSCPGYMNEKLLAEYEAEQAQGQGNSKKSKRKAAARSRAMEPHHNGDRHTTISLRP